MTDVVTSSRWRTSHSADAIPETTGKQTLWSPTLYEWCNFSVTSLTLFPSLCSYFGFITKHPMLNRFACHVFVSQESMRPVAECVGWVHSTLLYETPSVLLVLIMLCERLLYKSASVLNASLVLTDSEICGERYSVFPLTKNIHQQHQQSNKAVLNYY